MGLARRFTLAACMIAGSQLATAALAQSEPQAPATTAETRPPLISVTQLAERMLFSNPRIAPDGRHMAVKTAVGGKTSVSVINIDTDDFPLVSRIKLGDDVSYEWHRWAGPKLLLISVSEVMRVLNEEERVTRLVALDIATGTRWFVGPSNMGPEGDDLLYVAPDGSSVLLAFQKSIYDWPSVHRISLTDPKDKGNYVQRPVEGIWEWYADDAGVVRMGMGYMYGKLRVSYRKDANDKLREIARIGEGEGDKLWDVQRIVSGSDEGYVLDEQDDGRVVLARYNLSTRQSLETVYRNDDWDLDEAWLDDNGKPLAVDFTDDRNRRVWLDPALAKSQRRLENALDADEVWIGSRATDGSRMLVIANGETDPGVLYIYDVAKGTLRLFGAFRPTLDIAPLARPKPIAFTARDGTKMAGYLTLPRGRKAAGLPLIIMPHGGPYGVRDKLEYNDEVQLLANRGYAVLQPNYRGSGGYGKTFEELGNGQIGRAMQDDVDDAMDWAVQQGIADPAKVCVVGSSYGGYAAMWAVIRNPERYRCAASFAGVTDWKKILRYDAKFFSRKGLRKWKDRVRGEDFDLDLVSPARTIGRLNRPLLVAHGKKDTNVPFSQFKLLEDSAGRSSAPVQTLVFEDEGHGFESAENQARWFTTLEAFLAKHNPAE